MLALLQVSTLCVKGDLVAAGGFNGELVVKQLGQPGLAYSNRVTQSDNGITNAIEIFQVSNGAKAAFPVGRCVALFHGFILHTRRQFRAFDATFSSCVWCCLLNVTYSSSCDGSMHGATVFTDWTNAAALSAHNPPLPLP